MSDVYVDKPSQWEYGHQLWRSINVVILLTEQMTQSEDPEFEAALQRIHYMSQHQMTSRCSIVEWAPHWNILLRFQ